MYERIFSCLTFTHLDDHSLRLACRQRQVAKLEVGEAALCPRNAAPDLESVAAVFPRRVRGRLHIAVDVHVILEIVLLHLDCRLQGIQVCPQG